MTKNNLRKIWLIADTHFLQPSIIDKFEFRPKNYEDQIIRKIKNNVGDKDILIHLGDVIFDKQSKLGNIMNQMGNCTKILVRGNHDKKSINFYLNNGFDFVCDEYKINNYKGYNLVFSHIPKKDGELEDNYINIHGHLHSNKHRDLKKYTKFPERYLLYSAEKENYMPIILDNMLKRIDV